MPIRLHACRRPDGAAAGLAGARRAGAPADAGLHARRQPVRAVSAGLAVVRPILHAGGPPCMGDRGEAPAGVAEPWGEGAGAAEGMPGRAGSAAGIRRSAQRTIGAAEPGLASAGVQGRAAVFATAMRHELHARPEPDSDMLGAYMRDAIGRGGYRAALEYYCGDEAGRSEAPWHLLRARGWLTGRLGLYDGVKTWFDEVADSPDFDYLSAAAASCRHAPCRTPPLWLDPPRPVPRSADHIMTLEPVAASGPDIEAVPGYIWTAMLILDATGPICSHAGLGAASFLLGIGSDVRGQGLARAGRRYDPLRGARLHGAPVGCHRWIIADIDFDPRPIHRPHYYYDLTDEGRKALDVARGSGAPPWPDAAEAAASGLGGMSLSDLLENACGHDEPGRDLDKMRRDLGRIVDAWRSQEEGRPVPAVGDEDRPLVDLGAAVKWPCDDCGPGSTADHAFSLKTVIESTHAVACEAEPSTGAERTVLQTLIGAMQRLCRMHGRTVAAAVVPPDPGAVSFRGNCPEPDGGAPTRPAYADVTPALISDLYYCLAEYCRSRGLAVDPCSLPLSEQLAEDEKAAVMEALTADNHPYGDTGGSSHG